MSLSPYLAKALLDWSTGAAAVTQPTPHWAGLANAAGPNSTGGNEVPVATRSRVTCLVGPAGTPSGSASAINTAGFTFVAGSAVSCSGLYIWDASTGGNLLFWGNLSAASSLAGTDTLRFASGALKLNLL